MKSRPPTEFVCAKIVTAFLLTGTVCLAQNSSTNSNNQSDEISTLKAQVESLQRQQAEQKVQNQKQQQQYQDRISEMEAEMKALESKADSGSILNTRILTDADGKEVAAAPTLDESFLKSLTRNFTFSAYVRAGFQFNGNGGGGNFSFSLPDFPNFGRERLGNEDDTYIELTWMQAHMLGDSPDVMDVSMTFTPAIAYQQSKATFTTNTSLGVEANTQDFKFILRQAFLSASNVFKAAPEVTFWAGIRFYDRYNTDPDDYFWLDTSGYGAGVQNINVGIGQLNIAWIGGLNDNFIAPDIGSFFKHTFDVRLKNINVGVGTLALVLIGNYEKGGTFTQGYSNGQNFTQSVGGVPSTVFVPNGDLVTMTNPTTGLPQPLHTDAAWGIGGGAIYDVQFGPGGSNNDFTAYVLFGRGATNFGAGDDLGSAQQAESLFLTYHPTFRGTVNVGDAIDHSFKYRAGFKAFIALPWYHSAPAPAPTGTSKDGKEVAAPAPAPAPGLPWFSLGLWANWEDSYSGSAVGGSTGTGLGNGGVVVDPTEPVVSKIVSGHVHDVDFGMRPAFWVADNIALQGQFAGEYESNNTNGSGYPGFGKHGWLGVFDVGPVIKPKGGYYTKPEIRFFATYAIWSDSLKGMTTPVQENGSGDWMPPYNGNTNHGWLFGTQVEWFF
jgi:maltoporin